MNESQQQATETLIARCEDAICAFRMLKPEAPVLVAVSGGPDSVALLHALLLLTPRYRYHLGVAHLNHGIRGPAADEDAQFVENLAKKLRLPYYFEKIDVVAERDRTGFSMEEAGREARYRFLNRIADQHGYDAIAVGHHREDEAELILMNLLRGSGAAGLSGMQPVRDRIIRPLLNTSRQDILAFLKRHRIAYVQDRTNSDTGYRRNHIRHRLLPALRTYNPQVVETLNRVGEVLRSENDWIESLIEPLLERAVIRRADRMLVLDGNQLQQLDAAPGRRIVRRAILEVKGDLRRIEFAHVEAVLSLVGGSRPTARLDLPDRIRVRTDYRQLIISREKKSLRSADLSGRQVNARPFDYRISRVRAASGKQWIESLGAWLVMTRMPRTAVDCFPGQNAAVLDWDRLEFPLVIRNRRCGDRFMPLGMSGTQTISDFFANNKIPGAARDRIPLVVSGGRVVWIAGYRIDDRVKITDRTQSILKAELISATGNTNKPAEGFQFERL